MELHVFAYRDQKVGAFDKPIVVMENKEQYSEGIIRAIKKEGLNRADAIVDKALYFLGTYDDINGTFTLLQYPEKLFNLEDYLEKKVVDDGNKN